MNQKFNLVVVVFLALILSACASKNKEVVVVDDEVIEKTVTNDDNAWNTGYSAAQLEALGITGNPLNYTTVYFAYNSSAIDERSRIIARAHARHLQSNSATVVLEGNADERGTRDYNLALGERRANTVRDLMNAEGVGSSVLNTLSYGEERPVNPLHTEAAWAENRRVEIKY
jgi:peptidoglycan-associated lipoprotein